MVELLRPRQDDLVIGVEVVDGRIRSRGAAGVDLDLDVDARMAPNRRRRRVAGDGGVACRRPASDPISDLIRRVVRSGVSTMAAGGVASIADLQALRDAGAAGAVVGRAALEGSLDLAAAFAWARA